MYVHQHPARNGPFGTGVAADTLEQKNSRFARYCPYCQVSSSPSPLPQGLKDPPTYTATAPSRTVSKGTSPPPPPYTPNATPTSAPSCDEKAATLGSPPEDTLHFLDHDHDSITSLSFRYGVPAAALRQTNNITSDHLLLARRTILIPGEFYRAGVSLSPRPVEGEEEELRKSKIRRFMTGCKVVDYDVAVLYLEQAHYDLAAAMETFFDDEAWERAHPIEQGSKGKGIRGGRYSAKPGHFWRGPP